MYIRFDVCRSDNGSLSIIAKPPCDSEITLSPSYHKITYQRKNAFIITPGFLNKFNGYNIRYYVEKLYPTKGELFRMQPVNFSIDIDGVRVRKVSVKEFPYFSKGGEFVIPQFYYNKEINHKYERMKVSFNRTTQAILDEGYLFIFIIKAFQKGLGRGKNLMGFRKFSNGLRTKKPTQFFEFLKNNGKHFSDYEYVSTMPYINCPYGIIIFKEKE